MPGIMQDYFQQNMFKDVPNSSLQLSFAGTIMEFFTYASGPIAQALASRFGYTPVIILGVFLMTLGFEMAGFTSQIWHLYLTQGLLFGMGEGLLFVIAMGLVPQWFTRRRGLATGLTACGSGLGGLVFPFVVSPINNTLGVNWTYRILGFLMLGLNIITIIVVKPKYPQPKESHEKQPVRKVFDFEIFKNANYLLWMLASVIQISGFFVPVFFLPSYATSLGASSTQSSAVISVLMAFSFLGRILVGYVGDLIGRLNAHIIFVLLSGICAFLMWTFATSYGVLMAFAVVFGFFSPSYYSLFSPITAMVVGMEKLPTAITFLLLSNGISVFSPSIASAIQGVATEPFITYKMWTGAVYIVGGLLLICLKLRMAKSPWEKL
ncbi:major facilitator superfamily domain-containing protein [Syncephalastrum racemosum]|uniref:Major facilitator superfamily domain-containing protein n=1 Tax=Syncephalastrum racemosum TaxID=13706 RepID=A0A1X2HN60_SYNRA|nr:major facilitator superfamily domain-containing protein [Syncephalastrum racemosum]